jgi:hypothetical protein
MGHRANWKSLATLGTAVGIICLSTFANLASGAQRIHTRRPTGRIVVVGAKLTPAVNLAAGDRAQRVVDLKAGGRARVTLKVSAGASPLVDPRLGVRLKLERCSKAWRARGAAYKCSGRTKLVLADGPALGRHTLRKLARKGKNHLRLTLTLPASAPNALQGQSARLVYTFSR